MRITHLILPALAVLMLFGCGRLERHYIVRIPRLDAATNTTKKTTGSEANEGQSSTRETKSESHTGVWLARFDWVPEGRQSNKVHLGAIEILFCPADKVDFTQCRVGVGWSRHRPRLGQEVKRETRRGRYDKSVPPPPPPPRKPAPKPSNGVFQPK